MPIGEVPAEDSRSRSCGVAELDRVLGGGLVPGAVVLLAGEPGVGKSTLLLEVAGAAGARPAVRTLYVTGEESAAQVRLRADRTGALHDELYLAAETDLGAVLGHLDDGQAGAAGARLGADHRRRRASTACPAASPRSARSPPRWSRWPRTRGIATVWSGTSPRTARSPGPRVLEHLVDVVLHFEGDQHSRLRMVRAVKNRFGAGRRGRLLRAARRGHRRG